MKINSQSKYTLYLLLSLSILVFSCKHKSDGPKVEAPSNLVYSPSNLTFKRAAAMSSSAPTIKGAIPITYTLSTEPNASGGITIDPNSGVITAAVTVAVGTYRATVIAKNTANSTTFTNVFTFIITANPDLVTFDADIKPIIQSNCSPCHVAGGSEIQMELFENARGNGSTIINRINRVQGIDGFMPKDGTKLSPAQLALFDKWRADGTLEN